MYKYPGLRHSQQTKYEKKKRYTRRVELFGGSWLVGQRCTGYLAGNASGALTAFLVDEGAGNCGVVPTRGFAPWPATLRTSMQI